MPRLDLFTEGLGRLADRQQPISRSVLDIGIAKKRLTGEPSRLPLDACDKIEDVQQCVDCPPLFRRTPSEDTHRGRFDPRTAARVDGVAAHQVNPGSENALHSLAQRDEIKQRETLRAIQVKEHVDVGRVASLIARDRAENKQRAHAGAANFRLVDASGG